MCFVITLRLSTHFAELSRQASTRIAPVSSTNTRLSVLTFSVFIGTGLAKERTRRAVSVQLGQDKKKEVMVSMR